ncbi:aspartyl/lysyl-trna synthetase [Holotrichia oblita]|nr:aspartyl/lysyl-trna synthetase [Holotrichia oblita]
MEILNEKRTHKCGELRAKDIGETVTLMGWVKRARDLGSLIFLQLRDISGVIQIVFDGTDTDKTLFEKGSTLKMEYVIAVKGVVRRRTGDNVNPAMKTGEIEVVASELKILAESETPPFVVGDTSAGEMLRLKYRYLDLRREDLQEILILRSRAASIVRNFLSERGFLEIETPFLGKSTPEGARDYIVPSRVHPGEFYALPQSPQLYKQLLMIAGFDRYYQIVKCFRDEDLRANRQMEFTQIDIEMSFVESQEDVLVIMEELICRLFKEVKGIKLDTPFKRMSFKDAMELYGCDKPDLRYGMKITNICDAVSGCGFSVFDNAVSGGGSVCAIKLDANESSLSRKDFDKYVEFAKSYKLPRGLLGSH